MSQGPGGVALSAADFDRYRALVRRRAGIEIPDARKSDLEKGVRAALELSAAPDPDALYELLAEGGGRGAAAFDAIVPWITINETHFFRNRPQMRALEEEILPGLIEARRATRRLRIWSAGCSSGEEPYSLAILIDRLLPKRDGWDVLIHGTDIDPTALAKAATAEYGNWSFREVPAGVRERYFTQVGERRFELVPEIRRMVRFSRLNLVDPCYPSAENATDRMDLVVCRNVLIYFGDEVVDRIVERFARTLVEGGWLVVGHAEPSQETFSGYEVTNFPGTVVYRRPSPATPARARLLAPVESPRRVSPSHAAISPADADPAEAAFALFEQGRSGDAINRLQELAAASPEDYRVSYLLAKIFASRMRWTEAELWIDIAIANRELAPEAHYLRGIVLQEQGRLEEALEAFRRSVFLDHTFVLGHYAAAGAFAKAGQASRAQKSLATVAALLAGKPADALLPEGDGLTVGRLLELVALQRRLVA
jgi:chemotaxis protein methyltransferase CheR